MPKRASIRNIQAYKNRRETPRQQERNRQLLARAEHQIPDLIERHFHHDLYGSSREDVARTLHSWGVLALERFDHVRSIILEALQRLVERSVVYVQRGAVKGECHFKMKPPYLAQINPNLPFLIYDYDSETELGRWELPESYSPRLQSRLKSWGEPLIA